MALTPSTTLPMQHMAPEFNLLDVRLKENVSFTKLKGTKGTLVVFMCNHCPFVIHLLEHFNLLADELKPQEIATIAISSNDIENYPQNGQQMVALCKEYGISFPIYMTLHKKLQRLMMWLVQLTFISLMAKIN